MAKLFCVQGQHQPGQRYQVLQPADTDYPSIGLRSTDLQVRQYPDGRIAVFGPGIAQVLNVALQARAALDGWGRCDDLPEPVASARDNAVEALRLLILACP